MVILHLNRLNITMKTIILNQRKERDELMSRPYLVRRNNQDVDILLNSHLIKLITGPRRVGKSTQALLMLRDKNFAYLNFDSGQCMTHVDLRRLTIIAHILRCRHEQILLLFDIFIYFIVKCDFAVADCGQT